MLAKISEKMPQTMTKEEIERIVRETVAGELSRFSEHRHDGFDMARIFMSDLEPDRYSRGHLPSNYIYHLETDTTVMSTSSAVLDTVDLSIHSNSNVLVIGCGKVSNEVASAKDITVYLDDGTDIISSQLAFTIPASGQGSYCVLGLYSNSGRGGRVTFNLKGLASAGAPFSDQASVLAMELPHKLSSVS